MTILLTALILAHVAMIAWHLYEVSRLCYEREITRRIAERLSHEAMAREIGQAVSTGWNR